MNKVFSISEVIEASNDILNPSISADLPEEKKSDQKIEIKKEIINQVYNFYKKKIKKNTLKIIFDQELNIETLKKENNNLHEKENALKASNNNLLYNLIRAKQNNKNLETQNSNNTLNLQNTNETLANRENEVKELKNLNNEKNQKILKLEEANSHFSNTEQKINELSNKLKFYQEDNLRLSSELVSSNKKNEIIKKQLGDLGLQKDQIQVQIKELNNLINESNLVTPSFKNEDQKKPLEKVSKSTNVVPGNLDSSINKIFNK
mgnify:CR=1 FL=1